MKTLLGITVTEENGFFRVPADLGGGFSLVPEPQGKLNLVFCDTYRMRRYLRQYGFTPFILRNRKGKN